ncbi:MAG: tRNA (guanosine(37)-N1)-methyltransferase TrmD [Rickettsiaceae bacterium]|nr:tRNA (guanosine(37)-N1)-methyltransferase TrmD [Rickettsiaceae bacterium]
MKVKILTTFPEIYPATLGISVIGKALANNLWSLEIVNISDFGISKHKKIDDVTFGGGNGMIMRPDVLAKAIDHAKKDMNNPEIIYPSPRGTVFTQPEAWQIASLKEIIFICARFEGIDERIIDEYNVRLVSLGDYVLSGGDLAALVILESAIRLIPGVLKNQNTLLDESFNYVKAFGNLIEYPQYTRPRNFRGIEVPSVLVSGDHAKIAEWRHRKSLEITRKFRPDLLKE